MMTGGDTKDRPHSRHSTDYKLVRTSLFRAEAARGVNMNVKTTEDYWKQRMKLCPEWGILKKYVQRRDTFLFHLILELMHEKKEWEGTSTELMHLLRTLPFFKEETNYAITYRSRLPSNAIAMSRAVRRLDKSLTALRVLTFFRINTKILMKFEKLDLDAPKEV